MAIAIPPRPRSGELILSSWGIGVIDVLEDHEQRIETIESELPKRVTFIASAEDLTESSTTLTTWQDKLVLNATGLEEGKYLILWGANIGGSRVGAIEEVRLTVDDLEKDIVQFSFYGAVTAPHYPKQVGSLIVDLTAGDHVIKIQFRSLSSAYTAYIKLARIQLFRVA